jgi:thiamine-monophosphate kinase
LTDRKRISDIGEDALVAVVRARYGPLPPAVVVGPGDDAAVIDVRGPLVVSTDMLVEGYDFRRDWSSAAEVGMKTAAQTFADIAAMGARPVGLLVGLAAPGDLATDWAAQLADGVEQECRRAGATVLGGDVSQAAQIVITGTALGLLDGPAVLRSGARPGDVVALAGRTGPSGAGLALLSAGVEVGSDVLAGLVGVHRAPRPPYRAGPQAASAGATALIDTSDGLLRDAARVAAASVVVLDLDPDAVQPPADLRQAAAALGRPDSALEWVLSGGEDHALLACFPPGQALPASYRVVGRVHAPNPVGCPGVLVGGRPWTGQLGWTHFS